MEHNNLVLLAKCIDHLVTQERFDVILDRHTGIAATQPKPSPAQLPAYYQSDQYLSHGVRQQSLISFLYTRVQQWMFKRKHSWLSSAARRGKRYLDYGCGTGAFVRYLNRKGWQAFGVEPNEKARSVYDDPCVVASFEELSTSDFDVIGLWHVLEHVSSPRETLKDLFLALSPGGSLFLALPNFNSHDASYYKENWAGYDVPRHLWHFSSRGIVRLCESLGFQHRQTKGMFFDAFYISYLSEQQMKRRFPLLRAMGVGLWSNAKAMRTGEYSAMMYCFTKPH